MDTHSAAAAGDTSFRFRGYGTGARLSAQLFEDVPAAPSFSSQSQAAAMAPSSATATMERGPSGAPGSLAAWHHPSSSSSFPSPYTSSPSGPSGSYGSASSSPDSYQRGARFAERDGGRVGESSLLQYGTSPALAAAPRSMASSSSSFSMPGHGPARAPEDSDTAAEGEEEDDDEEEDGDDLAASPSAARASVSSSSSSSSSSYSSDPSTLRLIDMEGLAAPSDPLLGGRPHGEVVDIDPHVDGGEGHEEGGCLDNLPEMAMSSCVWVGSSLLSRMLFQIYKEIGDESKISTRTFNHFPGCKLHLASRLLTNDMANSLHEFLPETARIENPVMAFATYRDGWSMENLLAKTRDKSPLVILIRTLKHSIVFGAFAPCTISPASRHVRGNGEVFVFRLTPPAAVYRWVRVPSEASKASRNQFLVSTNMYLAFGAHSKSAANAIRIDGDLQNCSSGASETFQNPPLAPEESRSVMAGVEDSVFQVQDIEILRLGEDRRRGSVRGVPARPGAASSGSGGVGGVGLVGGGVGVGGGAGGSSSSSSSPPYRSGGGYYADEGSSGFGAPTLHQQSGEQYSRAVGGATPTF